MEFRTDFDNEEMEHIVCAHHIGICLDEITEPTEYIGEVIWQDGIISDDAHEQAAIQFWNCGY
jgi:hypothetical protein